MNARIGHPIDFFPQSYLVPERKTGKTNTQSKLVIKKAGDRYEKKMRNSLTTCNIAPGARCLARCNDQNFPGLKGECWSFVWVLYISLGNEIIL